MNVLMKADVADFILEPTYRHTHPNLLDEIRKFHAE